MTLHLSADIGGTKTLLQLVEYHHQQTTIQKKHRFESGKYASFDEILRDFLESGLKIESACFAIAGPVSKSDNNAIANVTNLPWQLDQGKLQQDFNIARCALINDFQAIGYAISALTDQDLIIIQQGKEQKNAVRAIIGAGTGLGQSIMVHDGKDYQILSTEGGHVDFAPNTELEIGLLRFLQKKWDHVSYERILSGAGITHIFEFLIEQQDLDKASFTQILEQKDPAAMIATKAQTKELSLANETMELFCRIYGAQMGNLALNCLPYGGLYIAGGIAAKNQELIKSKLFLEAFLAKGRMQSLIKEVPVRLITNSEPGLTGANQFALRMEKKA